MRWISRRRLNELEEAALHERQRREDRARAELFENSNLQAALRISEALMRLLVLSGRVRSRRKGVFVAQFMLEPGVLEATLHDPNPERCVGLLAECVAGILQQAIAQLLRDQGAVFRAVPPNTERTLTPEP